MSTRNRTLRLGWVVAALLADHQLSNAAFAATGERYTMTYKAPAACPSEEQFRENVASQIRDPARADGAHLEVVISAQEGRFAGHVSMTDAAGVTGSRDVEDATCGDVALALAFIASVAINLGRIEPPSPLPAPAPVAPPPVAPPVQPPVRRSSPALPQPAAKPPAIETSLAAMGGIVGGIGPSVYPAGEIVVSIGRRGAAVFSPWVSLSAGVAASGIENERGHLALWLVQARAMVSPVRVHVGSFSVRPCAGIGLGPVFAKASGIAEAGSATTLWLSVEAGVHAEWRVGRSLFLAADGGPTFPLRRGEYYFDYAAGIDGPGAPRTVVYTEPTVTGRAALGLGVVF